jgi:purine-binding chemotaxis protein CheW
MSQLTRQFCTFYVDNLFLGIDVQQIQEVIRDLKMTRVPLAHNAISGLINLRGQIVTAIDLRCRLGLPIRNPEASPMNVVVRDGENAVSLLVDEIGDVLHVNPEDFERPPETMQENMRTTILGTYKLSDRLLLVLDTNQVVQI